MTDQAPNLSDVEKRQLRPGLVRVVGALTRAWLLGMVSPRNAKEKELFDLISETLTPMPDWDPNMEETPLGLRVGPSPEQESAFVRLSDEEYLHVFDDLVRRYRRLARAYQWGMITANTPEQERQLAELRELLDE